MFSDLLQCIILSFQSQITYHPAVDRKGFILPLKDLFKIHINPVVAQQRLGIRELSNITFTWSGFDYHAYHTEVCLSYNSYYFKLPH